MCLTKLNRVPLNKCLKKTLFTSTPGHKYILCNKNVYIELIAQDTFLE